MDEHEPSSESLPEPVLRRVSYEEPAEVVFVSQSRGEAAPVDALVLLVPADFPSMEAAVHWVKQIKEFDAQGLLAEVRASERDRFTPNPGSCLLESAARPSHLDRGGSATL